MFMHKRGENKLCAQARWFCKIVQIHRACRRTRTAVEIVKTDENLTILTRKRRTPHVERQLFFLMRGLVVVADAYRTRFGHV